MKLYQRAVIRELDKKYNFHRNKSLGQNFIADESILAAIVEGAQLTEDDLVVEIGPGFGVLTAEICQYAGRVVAVELDKNLIPILSATLAEEDNVEIVHDDILKVDLPTLIREQKQRFPEVKNVKIIGNLPYYITTPIIMTLLKNSLPVETITVMMQKEVAERVRAKAGSKTYGVLSLSVQYYCNVHSVVQVPKAAFVPPPKVASEVLRLELRQEKPVDVINEDRFFACIKAGFHSRRKTLANCLSGFCGVSKEDASAIMESVGIAPGRRAETLDMEEFAALANGFEKRIDICQK